ncbi:two-component system, response regulator YesN [Dethiosulfatibacter aminovorans DSM 17477]|uniref:Two-component system, response regulator YesN n=1 Tax=Dethiosulfatibacter aminovorans DSM 17477 TaxID=1121476 RepID=A0A1M6A940_9FIRM|nr:response regulator [Dethiosulfatibacter aminovorans]SHI32971.1 two-component system, response regulator YesN [Dethiosulfatibacter aminovorans DSM 17477]
MYKLLIVDDEPFIRRGIRSLIDYGKLNIEKVLEASNGEEALDIYEKEKPEIILADINMPRMNGLVFAEKVKVDNKEILIAFITGYDYFDYAVAALRTGVDDYILKPVSRKDIEGVLKKFTSILEDRNRDKKVYEIVDGLNDEDALDDGGYGEKMKKIIDENIGNHDFSLTFMADEMGFSTGYLSTVFKKTFGVAFQEYVLDRRLSRAKILLLTTDKKNYEIADEVGFDDVNYFGTRFKSAYGMSPKQYKKKVKTDDDQV